MHLNASNSRFTTKATNLSTSPKVLLIKKNLLFFKKKYNSALRFFKKSARFQKKSLKYIYFKKYLTALNLKKKFNTIFKFTSLKNVYFFKLKGFSTNYKFVNDKIHSTRKKLENNLASAHQTMHLKRLKHDLLRKISNRYYILTHVSQKALDLKKKKEKTNSSVQISQSSNQIINTRKTYKIDDLQIFLKTTKNKRRVGEFIQKSKKRIKKRLKRLFFKDKLK